MLPSHCVPACSHCSQLFKGRLTVPSPIQAYLQEVHAHLHYITAYEGPNLTLQDKLAFF